MPSSDDDDVYFACEGDEDCSEGSLCVGKNQSGEGVGFCLSDEGDGCSATNPCSSGMCYVNAGLCGPPIDEVFPGSGGGGGGDDDQCADGTAVGDLCSDGTLCLDPVAGNTPECYGCDLDDHLCPAGHRCVAHGSGPQTCERECDPATQAPCGSTSAPNTTCAQVEVVGGGISPLCAPCPSNCNAARPCAARRGAGVTFDDVAYCNASGEGGCADGTEQDADAVLDCADIDCAADPACTGSCAYPCGTGASATCCTGGDVCVVAAAGGPPRCESPCDAACSGIDLTCVTPIDVISPSGSVNSAGAACKACSGAGGPGACGTYTQCEEDPQSTSNLFDNVTLQCGCVDDTGNGWLDMGNSSCDKGVSFGTRTVTAVDVAVTDTGWPVVAFIAVDEPSSANRIFVRAYDSGTDRWNTLGPSAGQPPTASLGARVKVVPSSTAGRVYVGVEEGTAPIKTRVYRFETTSAVREGSDFTASDPELAFSMMASTLSGQPVVAFTNTATCPGPVPCVVMREMAGGGGAWNAFPPAPNDVITGIENGVIAFRPGAGGTAPRAWLFARSEGGTPGRLVAHSWNESGSFQARPDVDSSTSLSDTDVMAAAVGTDEPTVVWGVGNTELRAAIWDSGGSQWVGCANSPATILVQGGLSQPPEPDVAINPVTNQPIITWVQGQNIYVKECMGPAPFDWRELGNGSGTGNGVSSGVLAKRPSIATGGTTVRRACAVWIAEPPVDAVHLRCRDL